MNEMKRLMCLLMHNKAWGTTREGPMPTADGWHSGFSLQERAVIEVHFCSAHLIL